MLNNICSRPHGALDKFKDGDLTIRNYEKGVYAASLVTDMQNYFDGYKRRSFVLAMLRMIGNKDYSHKRLTSKLKYQSSKLVVCGRTEDYVALLQKIYNFKTTKEKKVRFVDL